MREYPLTAIYKGFSLLPVERVIMIMVYFKQNDRKEREKDLALERVDTLGYCVKKVKHSYQ